MGGSDWETPTHQADAHYASSGENHQLLTIIRPVLDIVIISSLRINGPDSLIEPTASIMPERHDTMSCEMLL